MKPDSVPGGVWWALIGVALLPLIIWGALSVPDVADVGNGGVEELRSEAPEGGVLVVRKSTEPTLHFRDDQDTVEVAVKPGEFSPWVALPADTESYVVTTQPSDSGYIMCVQGKGCFQSNPGEHNMVDFERADEAIFGFQGLKPDTTIVVRVTRR